MVLEVIPIMVTHVISGYRYYDFMTFINNKPKMKQRVMPFFNNKLKMECKYIMTHILRTTQEYFDEMRDSLVTKLFEIKRAYNGRYIDKEDIVIIREYDPNTDTYSGRERIGNVFEFYVSHTYGENDPIYFAPLWDNVMKTHDLKTIQPYFDEVLNNSKTFEIRKNDRDFKVCDLVVLHEYDPNTKTYSGRKITGDITYVLNEFEGLKDGWCIFSIDTFPRQ